MLNETLTALLTTLTGAVVGGAISGTVAVKSIRAQQRFERDERRSEESSAASSQVAASLLRCVQRLPPALGTPDARADEALDELDVLLVRWMPVLSRRRLAERLAQGRELLATDAKLVADLVGLDDGQRSRAFSRFEVDRRTYLAWVIRSLREPDGPRPVPEPAAPATLSDWQALPWEPPSGTRDGGDP